jgi:hypothetical protein
METCVRSGEKKHVLFALNFRDAPRKLPLPGKYLELLTGKRVSAEVEVAAYGAAVLTPVNSG